MERRRTRLRLKCDDEEDSERRFSSRNRKMPRYIEDDEEDDEQPGPSTQNTYNQRTQEHNLSVYAESKQLLIVTCGNKMGFLDVEMLSRGQDCIRCEDRWFAPSAFEDFGGKGSSKKWKTSIFYENEPLQFWFEQGLLTTKGYKRRGSETTKQKKVQSSNHKSESSSEESEIQSAEDPQEDDVADEDWLPGSEELGLEPEEEWVGPENGQEVVNSGVEQSKEEEDKSGKRETEDENTPSVADDSRVFEEREAKLRSPTCERSVFQKEVKVVIKRLPEAKSDCQSDDMEHPVGDDRKEIEERGHCGQKEKERQTREMVPEKQRHLDMSRPEAIGQPFASGTTSDVTSAPIQSGTEEDSIEAMCVGPPTTPKIVLVEGNYENADPATSGHEAAQLQVMKLEKKVPQTAQSSLITPTFNKVEAPPSRPSSNCDLDTMDLDQLKREKIKMQIKVLKLQEEYYTQKLNKQKQFNSFTGV